MHIFAPGSGFVAHETCRFGSVARINRDLDKRLPFSCQRGTPGLLLNRDPGCFAGVMWCVCFESQHCQSWFSRMLVQQCCRWSLMQSSVCVCLSVWIQYTRVLDKEWQQLTALLQWKCMFTLLEQTSNQLCLPFNLVEDNHKKSLLQITLPCNPPICLIDSKFKQLNPASSLQQLPHNLFHQEETTHAALCP